MAFKIENDKTAEVKQELENRVKAALEEIGDLAETSTKKLTPVRTGAARDSFSHAIEENTVYIGSLKDAPALSSGKKPPKDYIIYLENGTSKMKPNHMLKNGVMNHKSDYQQIVKDIMKK